MTSTGNTRLNAISGLDSSLTQYPTKSAKSTAESGKDEFLQMLVTQLKNQDPLDPMSNDRFAVDLATFSQLEQLIDINQKLNTEKAADVTSLVGFLGTDVKLNSQTVNVKNGDGGSVTFDLPQDAMTVEVQLLDASGSVAGSFDAGQLSAGEQTVNLQNLGVGNGDYTVRVLSTGMTGLAMESKAYICGTVVGYIPGDDPKLLVGNQEFGLSDVLKVQSASLA